MSGGLTRLFGGSGKRAETAGSAAAPVGLDRGQDAPPPVVPSKPIATKAWNDDVACELAALWVSCVITDAPRFAWYVAKCRAGRARYENVARSVHRDMPWFFVAVIHGLECSFRFDQHLHNGDPLSRRTVRVPAGRPRSEGPWTWEESARDALTMGGKSYDQESDWSLSRMLWRLEGFNGYGYRQWRGIHSPYLWAGTNHYSAGKYVADGQYSATAVSKQAGAAGVMRLILER